MVGKAKSLGKTIAGSVREQQDMKSTQGLKGGTISSLFTFANYKFTVNVTKVVIEKQNLAGNTLIWGNPDFGVWNNFDWGSAAQKSFVLGNTNAGLLGIAQIGSQNTFYQTIEEIFLTQTLPRIAKEEIMKWLAGNQGTNPPSHIALGADSTSFNEDQQELRNEIARRTCTFNTGNSKQIEYQIEISSTDTGFRNFSHDDDLETEDNKDSNNTTANWDGDGEISFGSSTETAQSIELHDQQTTEATMTVDFNGQGTLNLFMSADGGNNFESVTNGQSHTFSSTGSSLKWKITGSDVTVKNIKIVTSDTYATSPNEVEEVGVFNSSSGGELFSRTTNSPFTIDTASNTRITVRQELLDRSVGNQFMTNDGLNEIRNWMAGGSGTPPSHMAWGTGTNDASQSDSSLQSEEARNTIKVNEQVGRLANFEASLAKTQANNVGDITESGLFNDSSAGTMLSVTKHNPIDKTSLFRIYSTARIRII